MKGILMGKFGKIIPLLPLAVAGAVSICLADASEVVGVVSSLEGKGYFCRGSKPCTPAARSELALFQWLRAGETVELERGAKAILFFASGARFEIAGGAWVTVGSGGVKPAGDAAASDDSSKGSVRRLASMAPLPRIAAIAPEEGVSTRPAGIRVRGLSIQSIDGLYPHERATALADGTTLRFMPGANVSKYRVEVLDGAGTRIFEAETAAPEITLSPGVLDSGKKYFWKVRSVDAPDALRKGETEFVTLDTERASRRAALRKDLETPDEPASLLLLAEIDLRLGLLAEAEAGVLAVLARAPQDGALRAAAERLRKEIAGEFVR